jgi:hypothetical protein
MVLLDDERGASPAADQPVSQERRNEYNQALVFMLAKVRCRGHALSCFLDELPAELIPGAARRDAAATAAGELVVHSSFRYEPRGELPTELRRRPPTMDGFVRRVPLAWIQDPGTEVWAPFWVRGEWAEVCEALRPGEPAPPDLPRRVRDTLARVGVLVPPLGEHSRREAWERIAREAAAQYQQHGYAIVRSLIDPVHVGAMRRYYRALIAGGQLPVGDDQVAERYRLNSEPVAMFFHPQLVSLVNRIAGEPVKTSYLYFASYPAGSLLPRHTDRLQCEFSISLQVDYTPEPDGPCGWPLYLDHPDLPDGPVAADLGLGDAVFYRGRKLFHHRDRLPDGHQSSSLFFHYVREDFAGDTF